LNKNPNKPVRLGILGKNFDAVNTTVTVTDDHYIWDTRIPGVSPTILILELRFRSSKGPPVFDDLGEINITVTNDPTTPGTTFIVPVVYDTF
jgi:hypothetical protein